MRRTTINLTEAQDRQIEYLQSRGYGGFTDIARIAIDRMYQQEIKMSNEIQTTQTQEEIIDGLNAANWQEVVDEYAGKTVEEIKAHLDYMFWSDTDVNGKLAQKIYDELN